MPKIRKFFNFCTYSRLLRHWCHGKNWSEKKVEGGHWTFQPLSERFNFFPMPKFSSYENLDHSATTKPRTVCSFMSCLVSLERWSIVLSFRKYFFLAEYWPRKSYRLPLQNFIWLHSYNKFQLIPSNGVPFERCWQWLQYTPIKSVATDHSTTQKWRNKNSSTWSKTLRTPFSGTLPIFFFIFWYQTKGLEEYFPLYIYFKKTVCTFLNKVNRCKKRYRKVTFLSTFSTNTIEFRWIFFQNNSS